MKSVKDDVMKISTYMKRMYRYLRYGIPVVTANIVTVDCGNRMSGKKGIITGGGKGLGYSIAEKCIKEGADVIITGRNEEDLKNATVRLGKHCHYLVWDIKNIDDTEEFLNKCADIFNGNKIEFLVNNAGVSFHESDWSTVTKEGFEEQFITNLEGPFFLTQSFIKRLLSCSVTSGSILFISSERGLMGDDIPYGLSKAAVNSLVKGLARRLLDRNIRVNGVAPGVTASNMVGIKSDDDLYRGRSVGKRVFLPEEVAELSVFLLSDISGSVSGEIIACDQGNYQRVR